jgi:hypothetical protein
MAAFLRHFCHLACLPKSKTPMSNIGGSPVFTGFLDSSTTFKTSAFNYSAISAEEKPASAITAGFQAEVNVQNGLSVPLIGYFRVVLVG